MKKQSKRFAAGIAAAVFFIAVIAVAALAAGGGNKEYDTHLEMAQKYLEELDYEQAIVELRMAVEIEPKDSEAYFVLAEVYVTMGDYESAIAALEEGYAAGGDAELSAERERTAGEYAELQEQERREQEEAFYEKYAELYNLATEEVYLRKGMDGDRYLTFAEYEQAYGGVTEQLEQYLADLDGTEGLPESLYQDDVDGSSRENIKNSRYFTKIGAYQYLADAYLCMGKLEECLRIRTELAEFCDRPDLVEDGNHGYGYQGVHSEYDRYGRVTGTYKESVNGSEVLTITYEESHNGPSHYTKTDTGGGIEIEEWWGYDSEGRILQYHQVIISYDRNFPWTEEYTYTGNHSFVKSIITDGTDYIEQLEEQFYDEYGRVIDH